MPAEITDERQPQSQKHLLAGAAAEPHRVPDRAVPFVYVEPSLVHRGRDRVIPAFGQPSQPAGGLAEHRWLMVTGHRGPGFLE